MTPRELCDEIRTVLVEVASTRPGFHLATSLGMVELAVAMDHVFDLEKDRLIFDIGHQRYPFDILARYRLDGILSAPRRSSKYDFYRHPGFAGLSISTALGASIATPDRRTIVVMGDGGSSAGEVFEALNHLGALQQPMVIVVNENGMSIQETTGALRGGVQKDFFVTLGLRYLGPFDGHDVDTLLETMQRVRDEPLSRPTVIHVRTTKGKGYRPAENDPLAFHQPFYPFDVETGQPRISDGGEMGTFLAGLSMVDEWLMCEMDADPRLMAVTPSTPPLFRVAKRYPSRWLDTGICEQHCMTMSTALALDAGAVVVMFAPFVSRCYSQLIDMGHANAPVKVVLFFAGVNPLGPTQQAVQVIGLLRMVPGFTVLQPSCLKEFVDALSLARRISGPVFVLAPKHDILIGNGCPFPYENGKGMVLRSGSRVTVLPVGSVFDLANACAEDGEGIEIIYPRSLKPFDHDLVARSVEKTKRLLIIEDGCASSGVGSDVIAHLHARGLTFRVEHVFAADRSLHIEDDAQLRHAYGVTREKCVVAMRALLVEPSTSGLQT